MIPHEDSTTLCSILHDDTSERAVINPRIYCKFECPSTTTSRGASDAAEQWIQTSCILRDNPALMDTRALALALRNQPPVEVVRFILSVNPKAARIPKTGPTPLQVAVQHNASVEVVHCLLEACPFALCVTNPDHDEDPLSYAKRHRKKDKELIELLSRPLSYWVTERRKDPAAAVTSFGDLNHHGKSASLSPSSDLIDHHELQNVKKLCHRVLKGHKKLLKKMEKCEKNVDAAQVNKAQVMMDLHEQQQKQFYRQLIALDMKEKAMRAYVKKSEERCLKSCDAKLQSWRSGLESWKTATEDSIKEWQVLLGHESKVNAHFRNDLSKWMEYQTMQSIRTPIVFSTSMGELSDEVPLYPVEALSVNSWNSLVENWQS